MSPKKQSTAEPKAEKPPKKESRKSKNAKLPNEASENNAPATLDDGPSSDTAGKPETTVTPPGHTHDQAQKPPPPPAPLPPPDRRKVAELASQPDRHRQKVAELATQLVSAQIVASAHHSAANGLACSIRDVASAYLMTSARLISDLESLSIKPELIDAAFVDRACADLRRSIDVKLAIPPAPIPLDHSDHDDLFQSAMARAQEILRSPLEDPTTVYAEQIFKPDELLSERQVGIRFEDWEWPSLENRDPFYTFIVKVEQWFSDHITKQNYPEEHAQYWADAKLLENVLNIGRRRSEDDIFRKIYEMIKACELPLTQAGAYSPPLEEVVDRAWRFHLIKICCGGRTPAPRSLAKKKIDRYYRPWGLFRYLRLFAEGDEEGEELNGTLKAARGDLEAEMDPHPLQTSKSKTYFGPLNVMVDRAVIRKRRYYERKWEARNGKALEPSPTPIN